MPPCPPEVYAYDSSGPQVSAVVVVVVAAAAAAAAGQCQENTVMFIITQTSMIIVDIKCTSFLPCICCYSDNSKYLVGNIILNDISCCPL